MRSVLWSAAVAGCVVFVGVVSACAKSNDGEAGVGVCASNGSCANDGTPSSSDVEACNAIVNGPCGSQFTTYANCAASMATCNSSGKSELPTGDCTSQATSYAQCMASDGGSTGNDGSTTGHDGGTSTFDSGQTFDTGTTGNDTGTTTGSCPGDQFQFNAAACQTCADSMCCDSVTACSSDQNCGELVTCIGMCAQNDQTCANACGSMYSSAVTEYNDLGTCLMNDCATPCGG
jgi:hypothetical protein